MNMAGEVEAMRAESMLQAEQQTAMHHEQLASLYNRAQQQQLHDECVHQSNIDGIIQQLGQQQGNDRMALVEQLMRAEYDARVSSELETETYRQRLILEEQDAVQGIHSELQTRLANFENFVSNQVVQSQQVQRQEADKERSEVQELQLYYDSQARQLERTKKEKEALDKLLKEQLLQT
jgi:hypothetical protein